MDSKEEPKPRPTLAAVLTTTLPTSRVTHALMEVWGPDREVVELQRQLQELSVDTAAATGLVEGRADLVPTATAALALGGLLKVDVPTVLEMLRAELRANPTVTRKDLFRTGLQFLAEEKPFGSAVAELASELLDEPDEEGEDV